MANPGQVITDTLLNGDLQRGKVVFQALRTSSQAIVTATETAIIWNSVTYDTLGAWAAGSPTRFTPPLAGKYIVSGIITYASNATGNRFVYPRKNGSTAFAGGYSAGVAVNAGPAMASVAVELNGTTDYLELMAYQTSGGNLNVIDTSLGRRTSVTITFAGA